MSDPDVAVVTGAAAPDGIGAACARALARHGCAVGLIDRVAGDAVRDELIEDGARAAAVIADLADDRAIGRALDELRTALGEATILVHCAADLTQASLAELDAATLARVLAVNVSAAVLIAQALAPAMIRRGFGRIVTIASDTFDRPPGPGILAYITSKGALIGATRALAVELGGHGITVNAVSPGLTRTGGAERGRSAQQFAAVRAAQALPRTLVPEDYAGIVAFLVSAEAEIITGQTIRADAGLVMA